MPVYHISSLGDEVGRGVTRPRWGQVRAVLKQNSAEDPYCVANELICGPLGQFIGLPIPPCGLFVTRGAPAIQFGTVSFNVNGDIVPPDDVGEYFEAYDLRKNPRPDHPVGTLLFDIWVANGDRNESNLRLDGDADPPQMHVFDHSWALFGRQGVGRLNDVRGKLGISEALNPSGNRHCLLDRVRTTKQFPYWLNRLSAVPDYVIGDAVERALGARLIDGGQAIAAKNFLTERRKKLVDIIKVHRSEFLGIADPDWESCQWPPHSS